MQPPASIVSVLCLVLTIATLTACGSGGPADSSRLTGDIEIDGSSTVFPITEAVAEEFRLSGNTSVQVNVGVSGTGGGFKRFIVGDTDISNASRPISEAERQEAAANGVEFVEFQVAIDGLSVMVSPENDFVECMTVGELHDLWIPESQITRWNQIRPEWPDREIHLYGPGTDSGTFDYFTEVIVGEVRASRSDYTASEDDNVLVQGIGGDRTALGYFGYAYYIENQESLKVVAIDGGTGCVEPANQTIEDGSYAPLSRPVFIYVNKTSLQRPEVKAFVEFYMTDGPDLVDEVGYVAFSQTVYQENLNMINE